MAVELVELICVILVPIVTYLLYLLTFMIFHWTRLLKIIIAVILTGMIMYLIELFTGQKTRNSQQRRVYVGSRTRQLSVQEPSIYVSPANLPPPPKYEAMAPPSYEEVVGVHYPGYQAQPITQPITHALSSQSTSTAEQNTTVVVSETPAPAVITVTTEQRRTSVSVRS